MNAEEEDFAQPGDIPLSAYQLAFDSSPVGLSLATFDRRILASNPASERILGFSFAQMQTIGVDQMTHPDDREAHTQLHRELLAEEREHYQFDKRFVRLDGTQAWVNLHVATLRDEQERPLRTVVQTIDITTQVELRERMHWLAHHDGLTGLSNRAVLNDRLEQALLRVGRDGYGHIAVLYIDLDGFKPVNDQFGHHTGDLVLTEVASRLKHAVRAGDTVSRLGGDEFVVLLDPISEPRFAGIIAERIRSLIAKPLHGPLGGKEPLPAKVAASIGVAVANSQPVAANMLLREADFALYTAKSRGGNHVVVSPGSARGLPTDLRKT